MTNEASKTRAIRSRDFYQNFFRGRVIDIGCGPDLVVPHAEPFDLEHGDAQAIACLRDNGAYDCVYSSHCLEHMRDVPTALTQWWSLVSTGGYLIIVVPDEDLYEQGTWPSIFNWDHKATFRMNKDTTWSPVSYDICQIVAALPDAEIISCERQDQGYDYGKQQLPISSAGRLLFQTQRLLSSLLRRLGIKSTAFDQFLQRLVRHFGAPVDQTQGIALAQIQVIAQKH